MKYLPRLALALCMMVCCLAHGAKKDDLPGDYLGVSLNHFEFRSIPGVGRSSAEILAVNFTYGTYLTDIFKVEFRGGFGTKEQTVRSTSESAFADEVDEPDFIGAEVDATIDYFASWLIGADIPLGQGFNFYGLIGFSFIDGDTSRRFDLPEDFDDDEPIDDPFDDIPDDFFERSFSVTWLVGADFSLTKHLKLNAETGQLNRDAATTIRTIAFNVGLKYQF